MLMSCSIEASWGKIGMTEIRICDHNTDSFVVTVW